MRSMTNFFGHYPSQNKMLKQLKTGKTDMVPWAVWVYYAVFIVAFIGFYILQHKLVPKKPKTEDKEDYIPISSKTSNKMD